MNIKFRCKGCGSKCLSDESLSGESFRCEICGAHMRVPKQSADLDTAVADETEPEILDKTPRELSTDSTATVKVHSATKATKRSDDIEFACKICGHKYRLAKEYGGHEAECAKCRRILIIPKYSDHASEDVQSGKIVFWCKACGQKYRLPQNYAHSSAHCSRCKTDFVVPAVSETEPPESFREAATEEEKDQLHRTGAAGPTAPPEHTTWLPSRKPRHHEEAVQETKHTLNRTRAQIVQEAFTSKGLQTQTSVEVTGNPVSMVRYVLASPDRNMLTSAFSALIDWIRLFPGFKPFPRKFIGTLIILFCIAAAAAVAARLLVKENKAETRLVNTMCLDCKFIETRTLSNINAVHCSKCRGQLGYPWKCYKCGKVFVREIGKPNENVLQLEKLHPPDCPICNSSDVKYLQP